MFYTNATTPNKLSVNDYYHDAAISLVGWITGAASSPWAEVTGSSPTPTWLQPYASTAVAATSSATSNGAAYHTTMYLTTDPGLLAGTPYCVMCRFVIGRYGLGLMIIDTATGDPSVTGDWAIIYQYTNDLDAVSNLHYGGDEIPGSLLSFSTSSSTYQVTDANRLEIYIWIWDECFAVLCKDTANTTYNSHGGGAFVFHPAVNGVNGAGRTDVPHIWAIPGCYRDGLDAGFTYGHLVPHVPATGRPGSRATRAIGSGSTFNTYQIGWAAELGFHIETEATDVNGNDVIQRIIFCWNPGSEWNTSDAGNPGSFYSGPWDEGPRLIRRGLISTNDYLDAAYTIDSVVYNLAKDALNPSTSIPYMDCLWLLPQSDLTV